jgi:hypothetical protein
MMQGIIARGRDAALSSGIELLIYRVGHTQQFTAIGFAG